MSNIPLVEVLATFMSRLRVRAVRASTLFPTRAIYRPRFRTGSRETRTSFALSRRRSTSWRATNLDEGGMVMRRIQRTIPITIEYQIGVQSPEKGIFEGGVPEPDFLDELRINIGVDEQ